MSKFIGIVIGVLEIVVGAVLIATGIGAGIGWALISAGAGTLFTGIGTLLSGSDNGTLTGGFATASRNPIAPWTIVYGRSVVGGTVVFLNEFGESNKYLDMIIVLASCKCKSVDTLLFDKQMVQLSTASGPFNGLVGDSFSPVQQTVNITHITRVNDVVTVTMAAAIPLMTPGNKLEVQGITGDYTLNGKWQVESVAGGNTIFVYICGGLPAIVDNQGTVTTLWADYGRKIHMEVLLGDHTTTFPGMLTGTADDGDTGNLITNSKNPWTAAHKLLGHTSVFLRFHYDEKVFSGGIPQISFLVSGKKDVYDPRTSPPSYAYTENAALCTADYLSNTTWGFKAAYGSEIPTAQLISAANICDENVALAIGGTEKRYTINGRFDLSVRRGEVLLNLLTACAGRLTYQGGQFILWPAAWRGSSPVAAPSLGGMAGPFRWKPTVSSRDLFNGVKGAYVSPANNWQASDIPPYAQDGTHGYTAGSTWSSLTAYVIGDIVVYTGVNYIAILGGTNHQPTISPTYWTIVIRDINMIADGGDRRWLDIQLPFTVSAATAQRLCKIELLRRRHTGTGTFRYSMAGYTMATMDVVSMNLSYFGWTGKLFEILAHRFTLDRQQIGGAEVTLLGTEIDVQETDASVYDWTNTEELTPSGYQQPAMPDPFTPPPLTGLTLESDESTVIITPGGVFDSILVTWNEPLDGYVTNGGHIEVQYDEIIEYKTGTAAVTNGSTAVVGTGTVWTTDMEGENLIINGVLSAIKTVTNNTHLILVLAYAGATGSGLPYTIPYSTAWVGLPSVNPSVTAVTIDGVTDGELYSVQARSVNAMGVPSKWVQAGPVRAMGANAPLPLKPYAESYFFAPLGYGFKLTQIQGDTGKQSIAISGTEIVNELSTLVDTPVIDSYAIVSPRIGNQLTLGNWIAQVFPVDAAGHYGHGSNFTSFTSVDIATRASFTVTWSLSSPPLIPTSYEIFIGKDLNSLQGLGIHPIGSPPITTLTINVGSTTQKIVPIPG